MALPMATTNATPQNPAFLNMVSLFLSSPVQTTSSSAAGAQAPATTASPAELADSMIRSMLGGLSSGSTSPASADLASPASPVQIDNSLIQSMLGNPSSGSTHAALAVPASAQPVAPQSTASPVQIADSLIQTMLGSLPNGATDPSLTVAPKTGAPAASAADARKQLRSVADLPALTAMVAPVVAPMAFAPVVASQNSLAASGSSSNMIQSAGTPQLSVPAPSASLLAKSEIAFTAILTPMKEANVTANPVDAARPTTVAAAAIPSNTSVQVSSQIEIVPSTPAQPTTAPLQTPAAVQAPGKEAQTGGSMQQQDDAPPQEQSDSTGTQARVNALTDVKAKPAELNREDNGTATPAHDRAADTIAEPAATSFPDQIRSSESAPATTTPASAAPFQGTAEAIRTSEPSLPADPPQRAGAAQEISIRIAQPDASTIDLRVVERSGQVHVDVRASDTGMQTSLRQDLGTLTSSLERAGYHSETFTPSSTLARTVSSGQMSNQDDRQDSSQNRNGSGDFSGGRRQQQQQKRPSTWLEELEDQP